MNTKRLGYASTGDVFEPVWVDWSEYKDGFLHITLKKMRPSMTTEETLPPNTPRTWLKKLWTWGLAHTVASAAILGALTGFIAAKLL